MISMATPIASEQLVLYYTLILLYSFNSLIWLTGIVEVVSTCSRQAKLITCSKKYSIDNNDNVQFLHVFNWKSNKHNVRPKYPQDVRP